MSTIHYRIFADSRIFVHLSLSRAATHWIRMLIILGELRTQSSHPKFICPMINWFNKEYLFRDYIALNARPGFHFPANLPRFGYYISRFWAKWSPVRVFLWRTRTGQAPWPSLQAQELISLYRLLFLKSCPFHYTLQVQYGLCLSYLSRVTIRHHTETPLVLSLYSRYSNQFSCPNMSHCRWHNLASSSADPTTA